eukprot:CAMPEP_0114431780 /NCGR_PEP_ID=MMETSP0103-20121206/10794_1 /TAXON_ID=37642 ORGANISM="Paraphysomonas imperforata, Strain PA2" /NCGR_SAMPLE_ID=MMETSP0103 /ASSEMBLY_ACC=CAM_ASM_000201 /LENGTH=631 /DNA_ID=CAMNT_0001601391 /DNA_START=57 /DNA_END=1952 /DNA_ORIENTATION=-
MGNSSTKEKGAAKVAIVQEQSGANESPEKAASVTSFTHSPEKDFTPPPKTKQKSAVDIESARPVMVNEAPIQHKQPVQVQEQHQDQEQISSHQEQEQPKPIVVPAPQALKPLKPLKPLGWSIEDEEAAKVDKAEKENMLMNKRIELDRKRLERKMEKQRQKELKEQEKLKKQIENATKEEKAAQEEQKTTQELLEEEEAKCLEAMKQMCSPTITYNLTSETWAHRKEGIEQIQKFVEDSARNLNQVAEEVIIHQFCAMTIVLRKFFQDRVAPVFYAAYDCFRCLLNVYGKYLFDSKEVSYALQSIIPPLITSMGGESTGTNRRTQREACRCVLRVARLTEIDGLGLIIQLLKVDTIAIRPRLALLKILLQEFSLDDESARGCRLTLKLVFDMCEPALNHSDDKVRKAGVDDIVIAYSMVGDNVRQYICNVKPAMLKVLEEKFDEVDRKKTGAPSPSRGVLSPQKRDDTLSQIQRDKEKKRGKKGGENIMGLLNPVVLTKTNSQRGDNFMNQLQNSSSSGSFLDQQAAKGRKRDNKDNAPYLSSTVGANSSLGSRLSGGSSNSENPERDSPPSPRNRDDSGINDSKVYRGDSVNRALFADLADGSYGNGGNGSFRNSPSGLQEVDSRFHIRD